MDFPHVGAFPSRRSPVFAGNVVVASQPLATQAGLRMLARGGNAVDAALAAAITLVVVEPTGNGLGSDAFCIVWDGKRLHGLNASGRSPAGWSPERFAGRETMPERGWESVTVPGAVSAWAELSDRFGVLPFATLFEPAVEYAEAGFCVTPIIGELWRRGAELLKNMPGFAEAYMPGGRSPKPGERFRNASLARSLRLIAETKGEAFYRGTLAEEMAAFARSHDAALSLEDLAAHRNEWCGTLCQDFSSAALHEIPPNGQGIAALMAVGILEHAGLQELAPGSPEAYHLQLEATKLALADARAHVGDAGEMQVGAKDLLSPDYLRSRAALIRPDRAQDFGAGRPRAGGTVCLSAGDADGMMVSYIQSNYEGFGSGIVVPGTGISLQNRGAGFSFVAGHPNRVGPSKRPYHTIIPAFVTKGGKPLMAFGLMGGMMQVQGHVQMMVRMEAWGEDPQTAADGPRWRFLEGVRVAVEGSMPEAVVSGLLERGHAVEVQATEANYAFGGAQIVRRIEGGYVAGSDPRKDGQASGF